MRPARRAQEMANPPSSCGYQRKAYPIQRRRREGVSYVYKRVDPGSLLWPVLVLSPTWLQETRTFNSSEAFCLQHLAEMHALVNPCETMVDSRAPRTRIEL